jgi:hypothetical protein
VLLLLCLCPSAVLVLLLWLCPPTVWLLLWLL